MGANCPSRGAAGTPRFGRRGDAPPSLSERWSSASCSKVKVVRSNVNARSCVCACGLRSSAGTSWFTFAQRGATVNATLLRTHGLKSGACRRPETERQSLSARLSHDSRAAFREFVTHSGTARPPQFDYRDPRGSLHAPRHSVASSIRGSNRPESPRGTCPTLSPATAVHSVPSRDLERSSRLEGDCCQCEREPRAPAQPRRPVVNARGRRAS